MVSKTMGCGFEPHRNLQFLINRSMKITDIVESDGIQPYPLIYPPHDLQRCKDLLLADVGEEQTFTYEKNGEEVTTDDVQEWVDNLPDYTLRHEALHTLQKQQIPEIFKNLQDVDLDGVDWNDFNADHEIKGVYFSRHPEIMAMAFDAARGVETEEDIREYERIGGAPLKLFQYYMQGYRK